MGGMGTGAPALDKMQSSGATVGQAHPHGHNQTPSHRSAKPSHQCHLISPHQGLPYSPRNNGMAWVLGHLKNHLIPTSLTWPGTRSFPLPLWALPAQHSSLLGNSAPLKRHLGGDPGGIQGRSNFMSSLCTIQAQSFDILWSYTARLGICVCTIPHLVCCAHPPFSSSSCENK